MYNILICDDEKDIVSALEIYLHADGYKTFSAANGAEALEILSREEIHLVLMDIMMPKMDGLTATSRLREKYNVPVVLLTAKGEDADKVLGLNIGADDYVTKPFKLLELLSRIRAILRRSSNTILNSSDITIDINNMTVKCKGQTVFVTPIEFQILSTLVRNNGVIVTRSVLLENIWDSDGAFIDDNTLSVHMSRLREKIGAEHIKTVRGIGYRWEN